MSYSSVIAAASAAAAAIVAPVPTSLVKVLQAQGYKAVQLKPSVVGHLHSTGSVAGRPVEVLVDTGASNTVIDIGLARELELTLTPVIEGGAGVGGAAVPVYRASGVNLTVGDVRIDGDVFTMDLAAVNAAVEARGGTAFRAVLGGDAMRKLDAVLLYRENTLLMLEAPR